MPTVGSVTSPTSRVRDATDQIIDIDNCNWLGGQAVADETDAPGFSEAGYANITTSDDIVHGQVKQSANFAFVRVYYSGHEVPFYQPLLSLEMLERVLAGTDVETGLVSVAGGAGNGTTYSNSTTAYKTTGTALSTFREGNSTVQFEVLPSSATYNTTTGAPNPVLNGTAAASEKRSLKQKGSDRMMMKKKKSQLRRGISKPSWGKNMKRMGYGGQQMTWN